MARFCVDSCFLIGLYDEEDQYHTVAVSQFEALFESRFSNHIVVAPWPVLYECCGTRQARSPKKTKVLCDYWDFLSSQGKLLTYDDSLYREEPLGDHMQWPRRTLSLVDRVIRSMIEDQKPLFDFLLTYNSGDFEDACRRYGIPLINEHTLLDSYDL